ncbi:MAG TPA: dihydrofolate reductase [Casimicrobiaceae bacterium]|nr:dihydrofolate reductase [Casimicrobiaceae bacterium]
MPRIALIAAVARNGVIGLHGRLPWRLPDDLKRFRALTSGHAIIMGRKTWDSIARPLPERQNIVVTRRRDFAAPGGLVAHSLPEAIGLATKPSPLFVIGGEAIYRDALPLADLLFLTEIDRAFDGDARFPDFDRRQWRETARESRRLDGDAGFAYDFASYARLRP